MTCLPPPSAKKLGLVIEICAKAGDDTAAESATTWVNLFKLGRENDINKPGYSRSPSFEGLK
jgi:hypothetical protein